MRDVIDTKDKPKHIWTPADMITWGRAETVARKLYPSEYRTTDQDCRESGKPCDLCAYQNQEWIDKVQKIRYAMFEAFGDKSE